VEAEGMVDEGPALLQIQPFESHEVEAALVGGWERLDLDVPPRTMRRVEVAGEPLLVANLDGTLVAYLDRCPACPTALSEGTLDGERLTCSSGHRYDVRLAGRPLSDGGTPLSPLPLLPEHGAWKVSVPHGVGA